MVGTAEPMAKPFPVAAVVFPRASSASVIPGVIAARLQRHYML
jgi:hypothetical protein